MSYSYVKSVFPEFKYSNVYDTKLYDTAKLYDTKNTPLISVIPAEQNEMRGMDLKNNNIETFQNNQNYYNKPLINPFDNKPVDNKLVDNKPVDNKLVDIQNVDIQNVEVDASGHSQYTQHILECANCKQVLLKQFNIESDRIKNEEIMELVSFIMFGLFILLLIDNIKK